MVGLIACVLCVAARSIPRAVIRLPLLASRLPPRSSDTIDGAEATGRHTACSAGRRTGLAVSSWLSCVICSCRCLHHACLGSLAAVPLAASTPLARSVSSWCRRSPVFVMPAFQYRPAHRHERRGARRGEGLLDDADRMMCVGLKKRAGVRSPSACFGSIGCISLGRSRS